MPGYKFNAKDATNACIKWIADWFETNGKESDAIVGISGGKDSTIVAKLCVEALGKNRVHGLLMPNIPDALIHDGQRIINDYLDTDKESKAFNEFFEKDVAEFAKYINSLKALMDGYSVCNKLGIPHNVLNIHEAYKSILDNVNASIGYFNVTDQTIINIAPRIRMTMLYAFSQSINGRVACTSNASERMLGYGTRWGDTVGDFAPLAELTCTEVKAIGHELGLPDRFVNRVPDDGLCGKTDEENFGFTYAELDEYLRTGRHVTNAEGIEMIARMKENEFKLKPIASFDPAKFID